MSFEKAYRQLWSRVGGKPWTHIIRDHYRKYPLFWVFLLLSIGAVLGHLFWEG